MLTPSQIKAIEIMTNNGITTQIELSKATGIHKNTIFKWFHNDEFLEELTKAQRRKFSRLATKAINKLDELIESKNPSVSVAACKEIISKAGLDAPIKSEIDVKSGVIKVTIEDDDE